MYKTKFNKCYNRYINKIRMRIKQLSCKHNWKEKGFGTFGTQHFNSNERRCTKCKKIEYTITYK